MQKDALCGPPHSPPARLCQGIPQRSRAPTAHRDDGLRDAFSPARAAAPATTGHKHKHPSPWRAATPRLARPPAAPPAHRPSAPLRSRPLRCQSPEAVAAAWPRYLGPFPPPACCIARATHGGTPAPPGSRTRGGSVVARKCYKGKSTPLVTACPSPSLCVAPEVASSECMLSARRCPRVFFSDFACSVPSTSLHPAARHLHSLRRKGKRVPPPAGVAHGQREQLTGASSPWAL